MQSRGGFQITLSNSWGWYPTAPVGARRVALTAHYFLFCWFLFLLQSLCFSVLAQRLFSFPFFPASHSFPAPSGVSLVVLFSRFFLALFCFSLFPRPVSSPGFFLPCSDLCSPLFVLPFFLSSRIPLPFSGFLVSLPPYLFPTCRSSILHFLFLRFSKFAPSFSPPNYTTLSTVCDSFRLSTEFCSRSFSTPSEVNGFETELLPWLNRPKLEGHCGEMSSWLPYSEGPKIVQEGPKGGSRARANNAQGGLRSFLHGILHNRCVFLCSPINSIL